MSSTSSEPIPILMPQAGNSMEEGTILAWKVKVGDSIQVGDVLYELETDKATIEVEAEVAGTLGSIVVQNGETAPVKSIVAYLGDGAPAVAVVDLQALGRGGAGAQR